MSQFASAGIQLGVLSEVGRLRDDPGKAFRVLTSGLVCVSLASTFVAVAAGLGVGALRVAVESDVLAMLAWAFPGLVFFSVNKVFFAFCNGRNALRLFAVMQLARSGLLLAAVWTLRPFPSRYLGLVFTASEGILLFVFAAVLWARHRNALIGGLDRTLCRSLFRHGLKGMPGNAVSEVNTRVDVVLLGFFVDQASVGLYSFAAMFAEGFQLLATVWTNVWNPVISRYYHHQRERFAEAIRSGVRKTYATLGLLGVLGFFLYPAVIPYVAPDGSFRSTWVIFSILLGGRVLASGYLPYQMILNQTGHPHGYSVFLFFLFLTNVAANLALIPFFGIYGAAWGTAVSIACQVLILKVLVRRTLGLSI